MYICAKVFFFTEQYNPSSAYLKLPCVSKLTLQAWENTGCHLIKNARVLPCLPCSTHPGRNSNRVKSLLQLLDKNKKTFPLPAGPQSSEQKGGTPLYLEEMGQTCQTHSNERANTYLCNT